MEAKRADLEDIRGLDLYSQDDKKIAKVEDVFLDDQTGEPEWLRLGVGLFGMKDVLVPLQAVSRDGDRLVVSYTSEMVKDAPSVDGDYISPEQESEIYRYYGLTAVSPSELNEARGAPSMDKEARTPEMPAHGEAPSGERQGGTRIPEEQVLAAKGVNDPTQVRLRKWVD
jgi:sporulation protein YlmC with PRC-barrel domain